MVASYFLTTLFLDNLFNMDHITHKLEMAERVSQIRVYENITHYDNNNH